MSQLSKLACAWLILTLAYWRLASTYQVLGLLFLLCVGTVLVLVSPTKKPVKRLGLLGLSLFACLFTAEAFAHFWVAEQSDHGKLTQSDKLAQNSLKLGYAGRPSITVEAARVAQGKEVFSVTYNLNKDGHRVSGNPSIDASETVLCFGGSLMFGEGVEDHETTPSQLERAGLGQWSTVNFAMPGYSAHQMLAILEAELESQAVDSNQVKHALYIASVSPHVHRTAGKASWDRSGPCYQIEGDSVKNTGPFYNHTEIKLLQELDRSRFFTRFIANGRRPPREVHLETYFAVLEKSQKILKQRYGAKLLTIVWSPDKVELDKYLKLFREHDIPHISIEEIIPGLSDNPAPYIIPADGHPNALTHEMISEYVAKKWLSESSQQPKKP